VMVSNDLKTNKKELQTRGVATQLRGGEREKKQREVREKGKYWMFRTKQATNKTRSLKI